MSNFTRLDFPYPCHVDSEKKMVSVFCGNKELAGTVMKKAAVVFPAHLVRFVTYPTLEELHK